MLKEPTKKYGEFSTPCFQVQTGCLFRSHLARQCALVKHNCTTGWQRKDLLTPQGSGLHDESITEYRQAFFPFYLSVHYRWTYSDAMLFSQNCHIMGSLPTYKIYTILSFLVHSCYKRCTFPDSDNNLSNLYRCLLWSNPTRNKGYLKRLKIK